VRGDRATRYGLGIALAEVAGRPARQHGGDIDGFTTFTAYLPDDSLGVTVLLNTQGPTRPDQVAAALVRAVLGPPRAPEVAAARPAESPPLASLAGRYGGDVHVAVAADDAGRPTLRLTRGPLRPVLLRLAGHGPDGWRFTDGRADYTFEPGAPSPAVWADLGVSFVCWARDAEPAPAPAPGRDR
jgi:hypothetical protein